MLGRTARELTAYACAGHGHECGEQQGHGGPFVERSREPTEFEEETQHTAERHEDAHSA